jgi:hypothetical protein
MLLTRSPRAAPRRPVPPGAARCRPHRPAALTATMVTSHLRGDVVGFWQQRENVRNEHAPLPPKRPKSSSRTEPELYRSVRPEPIIMRWYGTISRSDRTLKPRKTQCRILSKILRASRSRSIRSSPRVWARSNRSFTRKQQSPAVALALVCLLTRLNRQIFIKNLPVVSSRTSSST